MGTFFAISEGVEQRWSLSVTLKMPLFSLLPLAPFSSAFLILQGFISAQRSFLLTLAVKLRPSGRSNGIWPLEYTTPSSLYFRLYVFYLSKIYEFLDTAFLLVRGRRPKFLHVYHHFLTFLICYVGNETKTTYAWVAMMNNTLVHSLMYFYYAYNSFTGVKLWWCKYLTTLQMTQFVVNGMGMFLWMYMDYQSPVGCSGNYGGVVVCMFGMVTYFVLFLGMFGQKYGKKTSVGKSAPETDAQTKQTEG